MSSARGRPDERAIASKSASSPRGEGETEGATAGSHVQGRPATPSLGRSGGIGDSRPTGSDSSSCVQSSNNSSGPTSREVANNSSSRGSNSDTGGWQESTRSRDKKNPSSNTVFRDGGGSRSSRDAINSSTQNFYSSSSRTEDPDTGGGAAQACRGTRREEEKNRNVGVVSSTPTGTDKHRSSSDIRNSSNEENRRSDASRSRNHVDSLGGSSSRGSSSSMGSSSNMGSTSNVGSNSNADSGSKVGSSSNVGSSSSQLRNSSNSAGGSASSRGTNVEGSRTGRDAFYELGGREQSGVSKRKEPLSSLCPRPGTTPQKKAREDGEAEKAGGGGGNSRGGGESGAEQCNNSVHAKCSNSSSSANSSKAQSSSTVFGGSGMLGFPSASPDNSSSNSNSRDSRSGSGSNSGGEGCSSGSEVSSRECVRRESTNRLDSGDGRGSYGDTNSSSRGNDGSSGDGTLTSKAASSSSNSRALPPVPPAFSVARGQRGATSALPRRAVPGEKETVAAPASSPLSATLQYRARSLSDYSSKYRAACSSSSKSAADGGGASLVPGALQRSPGSCSVERAVAQSEETVGSSRATTASICSGSGAPSHGSSSSTSNRGGSSSSSGRSSGSQAATGVGGGAEGEAGRAEGENGSGRGAEKATSASKTSNTTATGEHSSSRALTAEKDDRDSAADAKRRPNFAVPRPITSLMRPSDRRQIPSLADVVKRKEEGQQKVVFLSKKQREKLKAEQERKRREQERRKERQLLQARRNFLLQEELQREREAKERMRQREIEKVKEEQERRLREARGSRGATTGAKELSRAEADRAAAKKDDRGGTAGGGGGSAARSSGGGSDGTGSSSGLADLKLLNLPEKELRARQQERELEQIRNHYLGMRNEKKKLQKPSEKFRNIFNFEWNDSEDTCKGDNNPLYQERLEPQLLFGRGFRAGMDIREQRKQNNFYDELVKRRQEQQREEQARGAAEAAARQAAEATAAVRAARDALISRVKEKEEAEAKRGHWTTKKREELNDRDWRIFREDFEIYIKGGRVPPPIRTWAESDLPWELIEAVKQAKYETPTPIQMQAIPIALEQRDLIGIAETGSGKTAAFVLPMLTYVKALPPLTEETGQDGPYALILAPSRELALQIDEETQKFASFCKCRTVAVVGGRSAETQAFQLRRGAEIVIGTPGRVRDCLEKAYTVLNQCNYVVLDEADRMIDMGFEEIVNFILDQIPTTNLKSNDEALVLQQEMQAKAGHRLYRLTQMFSATMPPAVERLARKYLRQPSYISIGDPGAGKRSIEQRIEFVPEARKKQRLQEILENATPPVMVFVNQKKSADALARVLSKLGYGACSLHGGKAQENREAALSSFKEGSHDVLVATDVAGRGIDVEGVQLVVNFDMPKDIEAYTHRIGRTGRAGKKGLAISFLTEEDSGIFYDLRQLLVSTNNIVPLELSQHPASKQKGGDKNLTKPMWFN